MTDEPVGSPTGGVDVHKVQYTTVSGKEVAGAALSAVGTGMHNVGTFISNQVIWAGNMTRWGINAPYNSYR